MGVRTEQIGFGCIDGPPGTRCVDGLGAMFRPAVRMLAPRVQATQLPGSGAYLPGGTTPSGAIETQAHTNFTACLERWYPGAVAAYTASSRWREHIGYVIDYWAAWQRVSLRGAQLSPAWRELVSHKIGEAARMYRRSRTPGDAKGPMDLVGLIVRDAASLMTSDPWATYRQTFGRSMTRGGQYPFGEVEGEESNSGGWGIVIGGALLVGLIGYAIVRGTSGAFGGVDDCPFGNC